MSAPAGLILPESAPLSSQPQTAIDCLARVAGHHGIDLSVGGIRHAYAIGDTPVSHALLVRMAKDAGLRARVTRLKWEELLQLGEAYPALIPLANGNWVVLVGASKDATGEDALRIFDPLAEQPEPLSVSKAAFCANWRGEVMLVKQGQRLPRKPGSFGFRWFIPELLRERRLFIDVAVAAILLYALGLAVPIFFQLVIDKVLVHESFTTLYVLAAGVAIALVFDALFTFLRRYLLLYATNKVDIRVATKTFRPFQAAVNRLEAELDGRDFATSDSSNPDQVLQARLFAQRKAYYEASVRNYDAQIASAEANLQTNQKEEVVITKRLDTLRSIEAMRSSLADKALGSQLNLLLSRDSRLEVG
jgi:hypothetical protein